MEPQESTAQPDAVEPQAMAEAASDARPVSRIATPPEGFRRCAMRLLRDQHGMVLVYELEPSKLDAGPSALVFESPGHSARLEHYPKSWQALSNDQLLALRDVH